MTPRDPDLRHVIRNPGQVAACSSLCEDCVEDRDFLSYASISVDLSGESGESRMKNQSEWVNKICSNQLHSACVAIFKIFSLCVREQLSGSEKTVAHPSIHPVGPTAKSLPRTVRSCRMSTSLASIPCNFSLPRVQTFLK